jgi:uncharacterized membrane protein
MFCKNCGKEMPNGAAFCPNCGTKPDVSGSPVSNSAPVTPNTSNQSAPKSTKSSTGLQTNVAGLICYLGAWVAGIIFLIIEKEDKIVRFHAVQSIILFGCITILQIIFGIISIFVPILWILTTLIWLIWVGLLIYMMIMTYQGKMIELPVISQYAKKYSK